MPRTRPPFGFGAALDILLIGVRQRVVWLIEPANARLRHPVLKPKVFMPWLINPRATVLLEEDRDSGSKSCRARNIIDPNK